MHGDRYDYSKVVAVKNQEKAIIGCRVHGWFEQLSGDHKRGHGCSRCHFDKLEIENKASLEEVLVKFRQVHGNRYDYSKVVYTGSKDKVIIICREHGEFGQEACSHYNGFNCPECGYEAISKTKTYSQTDIITDIITRFKEVHGDNYDYSKVKYVGCYGRVTIICKEHGEFE